LSLLLVSFYSQPFVLIFNTQRHSLFVQPVNLLSLKLSLAHESPSLNDELEIVNAVGDALRSNVRGIAQTTKALSSFKSSMLQSYETFSKDLVKQTSRLPLEVNIDQLLTVARSNRRMTLIGNESSRKAIYQWLVFMNKADGCKTSSLVDHFTCVEADLVVTRNRLSCLNSWKRFLYVFVLLLKKSQGSSPDSPLFQVSRNSLLQNVAVEVLRNFHENLNLFQLSPLQTSSIILRESSLQISKSLSGLLLTCVSMKEVPLASTQDEWLESLCRIRDILKFVSSSPDGTVRIVVSCHEK
jgi:hypothetical protein